MVIEEKFLKKRQLAPEFVVGCEGSFGLLMMLVIVLPLVYHIPFGPCTADWCKDGEGMHENALDALTLISNNMLLLFLVLLYWVSISFYNFFGLFVSKSLSAVHRTLIDASRTILVWIAEIILHSATNGEYGEGWQEGGSSVLQLVGFVIMLSGIFIYNDIPYFHLPGGECMGYEPADCMVYRDGEVAAATGYERAKQETDFEARSREQIRRGEQKIPQHTAI
jgi:hypothetical protein